jgi:iron-sulfur cluster assembly protein
MIQVSDTAKKKIIDLMQEDGFDAADYVRGGLDGWFVHEKTN